MKKKHRDIVVDGIQYGWIVNIQSVSIYKDGKKIIYENSEEVAITPAVVENIIKKHINSTK